MRTRSQRYAKDLRPGDRLVRPKVDHEELATVLAVLETTKTVTRARLLVTVKDRDGNQRIIRYSPHSTVEVDSEGSD